jgi:hypothetical protein
MTINRQERARWARDLLADADLSMITIAFQNRTDSDEQNLEISAVSTDGQGGQATVRFLGMMQLELAVRRGQPSTEDLSIEVITEECIEGANFEVRTDGGNVSFSFLCRDIELDAHEVVSDVTDQIRG